MSTSELGERSISIKLETLRNFVKKMDNLDGNQSIGFEVIIASLFPNVFDNIVKYGNDCYMKGYLIGKEDKE